MVWAAVSGGVLGGLIPRCFKWVYGHRDIEYHLTDGKLFSKITLGEAGGYTFVLLSFGVVYDCHFADILNISLYNLVFFPG